MNILAFVSNISLNSVVYGNTILQHLIAFLFLAIMFFVAFLLRKFTKNTTSNVFKSFQKLIPIIQFLPFYLISKFLILPQAFNKFISICAILVITICVVRCLSTILNFISRKYLSDGSSQILKSGAEFCADILLWAMAALFVLSNLGFNINTLLAGLGIGGMAIALASQTLLGDLFNYFTILIDKPFVIGDEVLVNGHYGTVKKIGLKGTRIQSSDGELVIVSNTDMTKTIIKNYFVMSKRRKVVVLGIRYDTPIETVKKIPDILRQIVASVKDTEISRVHFCEFADSSLNFELVYFVMSRQYGVYMDKVQEINFKILEEFAKNKIEFAYPSKSIYLEK
jgi:small-conductance mechanosensitive channel